MIVFSCLVFGLTILQFREHIFSKILNSVRFEFHLWFQHQKKYLIQQLVIEEGTAAYNAWAETPIPVYTKFYFFSLLSQPELLLRHKKPLVEERGLHIQVSF